MYYKNLDIDLDTLLTNVDLVDLLNYKLNNKIMEQGF